jgi:hypothetical protein
VAIDTLTQSRSITNARLEVAGVRLPANHSNAVASTSSHDAEQAAKDDARFIIDVPAL